MVYSDYAKRSVLFFVPCLCTILFINMVSFLIFSHVTNSFYSPCVYIISILQPFLQLRVHHPLSDGIAFSLATLVPSLNRARILVEIVF